MKKLRDWFFLLTHPRERALVRFIHKNANKEDSRFLVVDSEVLEIWSKTDGFAYADKALKNGYIGELTDITYDLP